MMPSASVAIPKNTPRTRKAGMATMTPMSAANAIAPTNATMSGKPALIATAWVYAPMPKKAACPNENCPVKPAKSMRPKPTML